MTTFIAQYKIEHLVDDELRVKYSEVFNALAAKNLTPQERSELQNILQRIKTERAKRAQKPPAL